MSLNELNDEAFDDDDADAIDVTHFEGVDKARRVVGAFLDSLLNNPDNEQALAVTVWHVTNRGRDEKDVWSGRLRVGDDVNEFLDEMMDEVCHHCEIIRGRNRYRVTVRNRDGSKTFTIESPPLRADEHPLTMRDFDASPDLAAAFSQNLRHNEVLMKFALQCFDRSLTETQNEKDELRRECRDLRREREASIDREEKVRSMQFARDMEVRKVQKADARKERLIEHVAEVGKRIMEGRGLLPPSPPPVIGENAPLQARVLKLVESLTPDQFNPESLRPEQKQMLQSIILDLAAWQQSAAQARPNAPTSQKADEAPSEGNGQQEKASSQ